MRFLVLTELEPTQHTLDGDEIEALLAQLEDVGFENPADYLKERFSWLYGYKILPRAGGLDDQDASFTRDLHKLFLVKRYQYWRITQGGGKRPGQAPEKKKDWQDVL